MKPKEGFALWQLGFRPFYLLAGAFAAVSAPLWAFEFAGWLPWSYLSDPLWHAHEMLFGFTLAVMAGFLLTAGRNWAARPTATGVPLALLALLWVGGRILVPTPFVWAAAAANVAFPLALGVALAVPFVAARSRRNYFFPALMILMAATVLLVHLGKLGIIAAPAWAGIRIGLDIVLFVTSVMSGRVVPMFTNNGVPGANAIRLPTLEKAALGSVLALLVADAAQVRGTALIALTALAAGLHAWRWLLWKPWRTGKVPLVWALHIAYFWIPVHLALRSLAEGGWLPASAATHALAVGAVGGLIMAMMTRTSLGHTGRALKASVADAIGYLLVFAAAVIRVFVPLIAPELVVSSVLISALVWSAAFALFVWRYTPILIRPRIDGQPG